MVSISPSELYALFSSSQFKSFSQVLFTCLEKSGLNLQKLMSGEVSNFHHIYGSFSIEEPVTMNAHKRENKEVRAREKLNVWTEKKAIYIFTLRQTPIFFNPFTSKILLVILLAVCYTVVMMKVWRIWH